MSELMLAGGGGDFLVGAAAFCLFLRALAFFLDFLLGFLQVSGVGRWSSNQQRAALHHDLETMKPVVGSGELRTRATTKSSMLRRCSNVYQGSTGLVSVVVVEMG